MELLTKTVALELADEGIHVNGIAPGAIATDMNKEVLEDKEKTPTHTGIKLKEIYETFDRALDRCADVADVVEDVALKYGNGWVDY
jgi:NAD(P)-dependent dehydrogenase (short-subunit alcohol dehydrogenase family)